MQNPIIAWFSPIGGGGQTKDINPCPEPFWIVISFCFDWINNRVPHRKVSEGNLLARLGKILGEIFLSPFCAAYFLSI